MSVISSPPFVRRLVSCWKTFTGAARPPTTRGCTATAALFWRFRARRVEVARRRLVARALVRALARVRLAVRGGAAAADRERADHPAVAVVADGAPDLVR